MKAIAPHSIDSVSAMHRYMGVKGPNHPMISVVDLSTVRHDSNRIVQSLVYGFYTIAIKKNVEGKIRYGQLHYDFDEGVMTFVAPRQLVRVEKDTPVRMDGLMLMVHPDFFQTYALAHRISQYGFFAYTVHEALHLSEAEEATVTQLLHAIGQESRATLDAFTQDLLVSTLDLLLTYCNRFYHRQFITRQLASHDVFSRLETFLDDYFNSDQLTESGLPSVELVASQLRLSPNYLSDMLRAHTGQSTQQHIHAKLIDKAKQALSTTTMPVSEIAYRLGFEYPQSFTKLFKRKTTMSPMAYRQSFT